MDTVIPSAYAATLLGADVLGLQRAGVRTKDFGDCTIGARDAVGQR